MTDPTTRYIVLPATGYDPELHDERDLCSATEAMHAVLTDDSAGYEIREIEPGMWRVFVHAPHQEGRFVGTRFFSAADSEAEAEADLAMQVIEAPAAPHGPRVLTEADFRRMVAEFNEETDA